MHIETLMRQFAVNYRLEVIATCRIGSNTVSAQPIKYMQTIGGGRDEFLFERAGAGLIRIKPGIGFCLRRFQPLIQLVARSPWIGLVKAPPRNQSILSAADDLETFLFEPPRRSLNRLRVGLRIASVTPQLILSFIAEKVFHLPKSY